MNGTYYMLIIPYMELKLVSVYTGPVAWAGVVYVIRNPDHQDDAVPSPFHLRNLDTL